jgi:hypothetical protein
MDLPVKERVGRGFAKAGPGLMVTFWHQLLVLLLGACFSVPAVILYFKFSICLLSYYCLTTFLFNDRCLTTTTNWVLFVFLV